MNRAVPNYYSELNLNNIVARSRHNLNLGLSQ